MSAAGHRSEKGERPSPRRKAARISPELDEVLRMLKALEEQPEADPESDKPR
jgi:hypothetical protein